MAYCSKCGKVVQKSFKLCYPCSEALKSSKFKKFGSHYCKSCNTTISRDRTYCGPCYRRIVK
jgi:RNA polymerase subunit RPABC4/transcription elongation factor Spt4